MFEVFKSANGLEMMDLPEVPVSPAPFSKAQRSYRWPIQQPVPRDEDAGAARTPRCGLEQLCCLL